MPEKDSNKIPLFKKWQHWYVSVLLFLVILIILFYFITKKFA